MILLPAGRKVWLIRHAVDFRKAHDGLLAEAFRVGVDPHQGDVIIFVGRAKSRLKVLHADPTGLWVSAKRFTMETMRTRFRFVTDPACSEITAGDLAMLLEGAAYTVERRMLEYRP